MVGSRFSVGMLGQDAEEEEAGSRLAVERE